MSNPQPSSKSGRKVLFILLGVAGVAGLLCCGGGGYLVNSMLPKQASSPAEVTVIADRVLQLEPPGDNWEPVAAASQNAVGQIKLDVAKVAATDGSGVIYLIGLELSEVQAQAVQSGGADPAASLLPALTMQNPDLQAPPELIGTTEEITLTVLGKEYLFRKIVGKRSGGGDDQEWLELAGDLDEGTQIVKVRIQVKADQYDEKAIIEMLENAK